MALRLGNEQTYGEMNMDERAAASGESSEPEESEEAKESEEAVRDALLDAWTAGWTALR